MHSISQLFVRRSIVTAGRDWNNGISFALGGSRTHRMHAPNDGSTATIDGIVRRARLMHPAAKVPAQLAEPTRAVEPLRTLPILGDIEPRGYRFLWIVMLAIILALYALMLASFWAPADAGIDQNAYLLGGKQLAKTFSTRYVTSSPFQYVGGMFVINSKGDFYPKYPLGLPLLFATMSWIFGAARGATMAFVISPAGAVLAVAGMFFLARALAGSFAAILCAILLATSQVMLELANNPNSHASCVAFVVWGMFLLIRW